MPVLNPSFEDAGALPGEAEHHEHRLDRRIVLPGVKEPGLVLKPRAQLGVRRWAGLYEALAEASCAGTRGVLEAFPAGFLLQASRAPREVPVQEEQGGQTLLAVERAQRPANDVAIDEVEADGRLRGQCVVQSVEEVGADARDGAAVPALRVVTLDDR